MPRRKKLKTTGRNVIRFDVAIKPEKSISGAGLVDFINLTIETEDDIFEYQIGRYPTQPSLVNIKEYLSGTLEKAKSEYLKIEIAEDSEQNRLHYSVQDFKIITYPGRRF